MGNNTLYIDVVQLYLKCKGELEVKRRKRDKLDAEIENLDTMMTDLNFILTQHGQHIYDHFEEKENRYLEEGE